MTQALARAGRTGRALIGRLVRPWHGQADAALAPRRFRAARLLRCASRRRPHGGSLNTTGFTVAVAALCAAAIVAGCGEPETVAKPPDQIRPEPAIVELTEPNRDIPNDRFP